MPLEQVWRLAGPWYANRLDEDWRPRTTEAIEQLFADAGLTGDFWRMTADRKLQTSNFYLYPPRIAPAIRPAGLPSRRTSRSDPDGSRCRATRRECDPAEPGRVRVDGARPPTRRKTSRPRASARSTLRTSKIDGRRLRRIGKNQPSASSPIAKPGGSKRLAHIDDRPRSSTRQSMGRSQR